MHIQKVDAKEVLSQGGSLVKALSNIVRSFVMMADFDRHRFLAMLPVAEKQALSPHVKPIMLSMKEELNLVGIPLRHLYFPLDAAISVMDMAPKRPCA
jgi:hypothetical protein